MITRAQRSVQMKREIASGNFFNQRQRRPEKKTSPARRTSNKVEKKLYSTMARYHSNHKMVLRKSNSYLRFSNLNNFESARG